MSAVQTSVRTIWHEGIISKIKELFADSPDGDERQRRIAEFAAWIRPKIKTPDAEQAVGEAVDSAVTDDLITEEDADQTSTALRSREVNPPSPMASGRFPPSWRASCGCSVDLDEVVIGEVQRQMPPAGWPLPAEAVDRRVNRRRWPRIVQLPRSTATVHIRSSSGFP